MLIFNLGENLINADNWMLASSGIRDSRFVIFGTGQVYQPVSES